jgi:hypothetical protein
MAYWQQCCILRTQGKSEDQIDPRNIILEDVGARLEAMKEAGHEVVLAIDTNNTLQCITSKFSKFTRKHSLSDILVDRHGTEDEPPMHARRLARIDYVMTTANIGQCVTADFKNWYEWDLEPGRIRWMTLASVQVSKPVHWTIEEMEPADLGNTRRITMVQW